MADRRREPRPGDGVLWLATQFERPVEGSATLSRQRRTTPVLDHQRVLRSQHTKFAPWQGYMERQEAFLGDESSVLPVYLGPL